MVQQMTDNFWQAALHCRPRTAEGYRFIVDRYLIPALGQVRLSQIRPMWNSISTESFAKQG